MLPWGKPEYLNIEWPKQNRLPTPRVRVPMAEALGMEFCQGFEALDAINLDSVWVTLEDGERLYMSSHYRFYPSRAYVVCTAHMYREEAEELVKKHGGDIIEYGWDKASVYYALAFRIGCTHPNMVDKWVAMHTRVQECLDCGYRAVFDTSD